MAEFILENRERILAEWEAFARTCTPASGPMDVAALRDHADAMLLAIARDLRTPQTADEQAEKSMGRAPAPDHVTAARTHGSGRAVSGFTLGQMISEYRALRASVIRLWRAERGAEAIEEEDLDDMTRFSEAIDQALAESLAEYTDELAHSREMFLAILGHDLRTPLAAIFTASEFLLEIEEMEEPQLSLISRIAKSSNRMVGMVEDLLDFTQSRMGGGIPITRTDTSVGKLVHEVVDEVAAAHPGRPIEIEAGGEHVAAWDAGRIGQALSNLIGNAVEHGHHGTAVRVEVAADDEEVTIEIRNAAVIPREELDGIFNPMKGGGTMARSAGARRSGGLGLGLFIADQVVAAHEGTISVESSEARGTTFTVRLPLR